MELAPTNPPISPVLEMPPPPRKINVFEEGALVFSRLTLIRQLGQGRCSAVWLAEDHRFRRNVAVKAFHSSSGEVTAAERNVWNELLRRLRILNHPSICMPLEFFSDGRWAAIASSYIEGTTLAKKLLGASGKHLTFASAHTLLVQIGLGINACHGNAKIIHGNLNASNILLTRDGDVRISDFGFYPVTESNSPEDTDLLLKRGTLSPERIQGENPSFSDDIYAFGALCFQVLTGTNPHPVDHEGSGENENALQKVAGLPEMWRKQILAALSFKPSLRPATLQEIMEVIAPDELSKSTAPVTPLPIPTRSRGRSSRKRKFRKNKDKGAFWLKILTILCALVLPAILTLLITSNIKESRRLEKERTRGEVLEKAVDELERARLRAIEDRLNAAPEERARLAAGEATPTPGPTPTPTPIPPANKEFLQFYSEGQARQKAGDYAGAFESYEMAVVLQSDWPDLLEARGEVLVALNRADEAVDEYNKALFYAPNRISALLGRGRAFHQLNNNLMARQDFETVLQIQPDSVEAKTELDGLDKK